MRNLLSRMFFGRFGKLEPKSRPASPPRRHGLRLEALESRQLLTVSAVWSPLTGDLAISGDDLPNSITVGTEKVGSTVYPVVVGDGAVVWQGSTQTTPVSAASVATITVTPGKKADLVDLSRVAPSSGFTGMASGRPVSVALGADGGEGGDAIIGSQFGDQIETGKGSDYVDGQGGDDVIIGGDGAEGRLDGNYDVLIGGAGNDQISGNDGGDMIVGGLGDDLLDGGNADDVIFGGDGDDTILGDAGGDTLYGGGGDDALTGGDGNDNLYGDAGNDNLTGGTGDDRYLQRFYPGDMNLTGAIIIARGTGNSFSIADGNVFGLGTDTLVEASGEGTDILDFSDYRGSYSAPSLPSNFETLLGPAANLADAVTGLTVDTSVAGSLTLSSYGGTGNNVAYYFDATPDGRFDPTQDSLLGTVDNTLTAGSGTVNGNAGQKLTVSFALPLGGQTIFAVPVDGSGNPIAPATAAVVFNLISTSDSAAAAANAEPLEFPAPLNATFQRQANDGQIVAFGGVSANVPPGAPTVRGAGIDDRDFTAAGGSDAVADSGSFLDGWGVIQSGNATGSVTEGGVATGGSQPGIGVSGAINLVTTGNGDDGPATGTASGSLRSGTLGTSAHAWELQAIETGMPQPDRVFMLFDLQYLFAAPGLAAGEAAQNRAGDEFSFRITINGPAATLIDLHRRDGVVDRFNVMGQNLLPLNAAGALRPQLVIPLEIGDVVRVTYSLTESLESLGGSVGPVSEHESGSAAAVSAALYNLIVTPLDWQ